MSKEKKTEELLRQMRTSWSINPRTRVREDDRKSAKKRRQEEKKLTHPEE